MLRLRFGISFLAPLSSVVPSMLGVLCDPSCSSCPKSIGHEERQRIAEVPEIELLQLSRLTKVK